MYTPEGGSDLERVYAGGTVAVLEALFAQEVASYTHEKICGSGPCLNVALWRVIWDEGACSCLPTYVCGFGRLLVEEAMDNLGALECGNCGSDLVPAIIVANRSI